ncbi:MAG: deoxyribodipyrimidine photo-lyase, partial [Flavobacteriaceae bacterium]
MLINKIPTAVVWLKRDLRLRDHAALHWAQKNHKQVLLLYIAEPSLREEAHSSKRHFDFIKQSLVDLNQQLNAFNSAVLTVVGEVIDVLNQLNQLLTIEGIYSHLETGIAITYQRDRNVANWCHEHNIPWVEKRQQGVFRGMRNRKNWIQHWTQLMNKEQYPAPSKKGFIHEKEIAALKKHFKTLDCATTPQKGIQPGGEKAAYRYLDSFFEGRYQNYQIHISKPDLARKSCSRLSPYIAYGNLSMRQVLRGRVA